MEKKELDLLKDNLIRQQEQGESMVKLVDEMQRVERDMNLKYDEIQDLVERANERITLEGVDAKYIQSTVAKKAYDFAKIVFPNDTIDHPNFSEAMGFARRKIYSRIKNHFNVTKYSHIKHTQREEAKNYTNSINFGHDYIFEYKKWRNKKLAKQKKEIEDMNNL